MYWAHSACESYVRALRAESIEAGRAAWRADAAADVAAACATLFWMEGAENWRFACGVKVIPTALMGGAFVSLPLLVFF